jgi:hypothetical protein
MKKDFVLRQQTLELKELGCNESCFEFMIPKVCTSTHTHNQM